MTNDKFCLTLEDYGYPRHSSIVRRYYGTMEDVEGLMDRLNDDAWTQTRYWETLDAFDCYEQDNEVTHAVAGTEVQFLAPVATLAVQYAVLEKHRWTYTGYIVSTNLPFSEWLTMFENQTMVAAMIDRLTY